MFCPVLPEKKELCCHQPPASYRYTALRTHAVMHQKGENQQPCIYTQQAKTEWKHVYISALAHNSLSPHCYQLHLLQRAMGLLFRQMVLIPGGRAMAMAQLSTHTCTHPPTLVTKHHTHRMIAYKCVSVFVCVWGGGHSQGPLVNVWGGVSPWRPSGNTCNRAHMLVCDTSHRTRCMCVCDSYSH